MQTLRQKKSYNSLNSHNSPFFFRQRGLLSFFISVAYLRQFPFRPIPFLSPPLLSFGISLFVSAKLGGLEMPLPLRPASPRLFFVPWSGSDPDIFFGTFWVILDKNKKNIVFRAPKFAYIKNFAYLCTRFQDHLSSTNPLIH